MTAKSGIFGSTVRPNRSLQDALAFRLARKIVPAVTGGKIGIDRGIPHRGIDAVENARDAIAAVVQIHPHAHAADWPADFVRVSRRNGGDDIGILDAGFEQVDPAKILELVRRLVVGTKAVEAEHGRIEFSLVTDVVDGENAGRIGERREHPVPCFKEDRRDGSHPVVHMGHMGNPVCVLANLQRRLAQDHRNDKSLPSPA